MGTRIALTRSTAPTLSTKVRVHAQHHLWHTYQFTNAVILALRGEGFIETIRFFTWVILNADESPLLE